MSQSLSYLANLNERQREAVEATEGPLIVLAGAGSGKTKMLTTRIVHLVEAKRVPPNAILAVTFTNKAAGEMKERVEKQLRECGSGALGWPEIGTFHSICVRLLRREAAYTPFTKPFVIYDDSDQLSLIKTACQKLSIDEKAFSPKALRSGIDRLKCDAVEPHELEPASYDVFQRKLKLVYEQYQKDLVAANALDFGEILCLTYRLLRDNPDMRARYQHRWRYLHVDEYQDTNRAQYLLLRQLACGNICVVGDEDQSIYKWRGADIRNILDFEKDYPGARVVKLEQNYRSTQTIITAASQVISNNTQRKDKRLWTDNAAGAPVTRLQLPDERAEAATVISEIKRLAAADGLSYREFAIFYRTHAQSRQFEDELRREKIAYQIVGGLKFYDRKEIKDVLSYFRVFTNPDDSVSLKRIINVPGRGIGKTTVERLEELQARLERGEAAVPGGDSAASPAPPTFWSALRLAAAEPELTSKATAKKLGQFVAFIERMTSEVPKLSVSALYHLLLDEIGLVRELRAEATDEALARIENLEELDSILQEFEQAQAAAAGAAEGDTEAGTVGLLPRFLEETTLNTDADREAAASAGLSAVQMMSLHSSKGLEFPVVFLVGMEEGLFPSVRAWEEEKPEDIEEERRLCYVGMTRARQRLYLTNVLVRRLWGNVSYQEPARFFAELPTKGVELRDMTVARTPVQSSGYSGGSYSSGGYSGGGYSSGGYSGGGGYSGARANGGGARQATIDPIYDDDVDSGGGAGDLVGLRIAHPEYGAGTVIGVEGSGDARKVTIEFRGRDRRKFVWKYVAGMQGE